MADTTPRGAKNRLEQIRPKEVSLVDRAANEWEFLVVKRRGDTLEDNMEIVRDENGNLITKSKGQEEEEKKAAIDATLRKAGERLMALAEKAKGKALDKSAGEELKAVAGLLQEALKSYPAPTSKDASDPDATVKFDILTKGNATDEGVLQEMTTRVAKFDSFESDEAKGAQLSGMASFLVALAKAAGADMDEEDEEAKAKKAKAEAEAKAKEEEAKKAAKAKEEEEEKRGGGSRKRFTPQRTAKLLQGLASIAEVMKEVDAGSLGDLFAVAKSDKSEEGTLIAKRLEEVAPDGKVEVIAKSMDSALVEGLRSELTDVRKRLARFEDSAVSKSLGSDGQPVEKSKGDSIFKGIV